MIRAILFDLDNTLYHPSVGMEEETVQRMIGFSARYLGISEKEAWELRKSCMPAYGTTLEWLMADHGFKDPEAFFAQVHPAGEEYALEPDPALAAFLDSLPLPSYIFTNAPKEHADRVVKKLGIEGRFRQVFDIRYNKLSGKPNAQAVDRVLAAVRADCGAEPHEVLFVDDIPRYVRGFVQRGGFGVLIDQKNRHNEPDLPTVTELSHITRFLAKEPA